MEAFLTYLLKSAALLSIFLLAYQLLLRNDTSFQINRHFLFWGILASLLLPALEFTKVVHIESVASPMTFPISTEVQQSPPAPPEVQAIDWWQAAGIIYALITVAFLLRFAIQLSSLLILIRSGQRTKEGKFSFIRSGENLTPFSFFHYIVFNPKLHAEEELEIVLQHEKIHATQWHSADVLLANLTAAVLWFNPLSWWYKKSLVQNLEYIADKETVAASISRKKYQHTLLKISVADLEPALANNFYQSFIKKRIMMLNKQPSHTRPLLKIGMVLPFICAFMFFFNVRTEAQVVSKSEASNVTYQEDFKLTATISKHTREETLDKIENFFGKNGVDLEFELVEYSEDGLLTKVGVSYLKRDSGQSGNMVLQDSNGIGDWKIALGEDGFSLSPLSLTESILNKIGLEPLYIINGEQLKASELFGKTVSIEGNISALPKSVATKKYGKQAEGGAIIISKGEILDDTWKSVFENNKQQKNVESTYIEVREGEKPTLISAVWNSTPSEASQAIIPEAEDINASLDPDKNTKLFSQRSVLFIVNGKVMEEGFSIEDLDAELIESVYIPKGEELLEKYGERASNGVVSVTTKEKDGKNGESFTYTAEKIVFSEDADGEGKTIVILDVRDASFSPDENQLFAVDGKVMGADFKVEEFDADRIESVSVLKGKIATDKYGEIAEEGIIEIETIQGE